MHREEEDILREIKILKEELASLKKKKDSSKNIRPFFSFSIDEKMAIFERFYDMASSEIEHLEENGVSRKDFPNWCFKEVMGILSVPGGPSFWNYYHSLSKHDK